jgi:hypothetical protein
MARIGNGTCGRPSNTVGARNVLTHHISTQLREREGKALANFSRTLPAEDSDLTQQNEARQAQETDAEEVVTGESIMSTVLVRREQPTGGAGSPHSWRCGAAADGADERCF